MIEFGSRSYDEGGLIRSAGSLAEGGENVIHLKEVATSIPSVLHAIHRHVVIELRVEGDPATKRQDRNFETTATEAAIFHFWIGSKCGGSVHATNPRTYAGK